MVFLRFLLILVANLRRKERPLLKRTTSCTNHMRNGVYTMTIAVYVQQRLSALECANDNGACVRTNSPNTASKQSARIFVPCTGCALPMRRKGSCCCVTRNTIGRAVLATRSGGLNTKKVRERGESLEAELISDWVYLPSIYEST